MRTLQGTYRLLFKIIAVVMGIYHMLYYGGIFQALNIVITSIPHRATSLGFLLVLTFLLWPINKSAPKDRVPWYDLVFIALAVLANGYMVIFYNTLVLEHVALSMITPFELVLGISLIFLIVEAARRVLGLAMPLIASFFIIHPFIAQYLPGILNGRDFSLERVVRQFYMHADGIYGIAVGVSATIIIAFIAFGQVLQVTGGGKFFFDMAFALTGRLRGGPAKAAIVASAFMGMFSGSGVANVATVGVFTIPLMKKSGYSPHFAGGVEAVASNGGQLTPPVMGAVAFIMAEMLEVSFGMIIAAAAVPALLYYFSLFMQVDLEAARTGIKGLGADELPSAWQTFKNGWYYLLPIAVLVYLLIGPQLSAEKAAWWAMVSIVVVTLFKKEERINLNKSVTVFEETAKTMTNVATAVAAAGILMASLGLTGVSVKLASTLLDASMGNLLILLILTAISSFILGMGLPSIPCYLMVAILIAPAMIKVGVPPMAAHMFAFWYGVTSFITPPVALCSYAAAAIAGADIMKTGWTAVRLGIITFILPFIFVYNPQLLLIGSMGDITQAVVTSVIGVILLAVGLEGYGLSYVKKWERAVVLTAGMLMIIPGWETDLAGIIVGILMLIVQVYRKRVDQTMSEHMESKLV